MTIYHSSTPWVSANDRFKAQSGDWMSVGVIAAVLAHGGLFALFPEMNALDLGFTSEESEVVDLPPEVEIPPPPDDIARPATPVVPDHPVDDDVTVPKNTWADNPVAELPPPPSGARPSDVPAWIPRDVEPALTNRREVERVLEQRYPARLREVGIGGTVVLHVFVDADGVPTRSQVIESSGYPQLDDAAREVVDRMKFSPALNRDRPVGVWVRQGVTFTAD
jgi:protein TonB